MIKLNKNLDITKNTHYLFSIFFCKNLNAIPHSSLHAIKIKKKININLNVFFKNLFALQQSIARNSRLLHFGAKRLNLLGSCFFLFSKISVDSLFRNFFLKFKFFLKNFLRNSNLYSSLRFYFCVKAISFSLNFNSVPLNPLLIFMPKVKLRQLLKISYFKKQKAFFFRIPT